MLRSAGLPQDEIDNIMGDLDTLDLYGDLADSFRDLVDELGDQHLVNKVKDIEADIFYLLRVFSRPGSQVALSGLGLGLSTNYSGAERWLSYNLRAYWGEEELLSLRAAADDISS